EPSASMLTERFKQKPCESLSRNAARRGGKACSSKEVPEKGMERRGLSYRGRLMGSTGFHTSFADVTGNRRGRCAARSTSPCCGCRSQQGQRAFHAQSLRRSA